MTPHRGSHRDRGYTIVELMVGLALSVMFIATAAPFAISTRHDALDAKARIDALTDLRAGLAAFADDVRAGRGAFIEDECILIFGDTPACWQRHADGRLIRTTPNTTRCVARNVAAFVPRRGAGTVALTWALTGRHAGSGPIVRAAFALGGAR